MALSLRLAARLSIRDNDFDRARTLLARAVEIHESLGEADDLESRRGLERVGLALRSTDDFEGAKCATSVLFRFISSPGPRHEKVAVCTTISQSYWQGWETTPAPKAGTSGRSRYTRTGGPEPPPGGGLPEQLRRPSDRDRNVAGAVKLLRRSLEMPKRVMVPNTGARDCVGQPGGRAQRFRPVPGRGAAPRSRAPDSAGDPGPRP